MLIWVMLCFLGKVEGVSGGIAVYFCEFWFLLYEKIMRFSPWKIGKYTRCWDQYLWVAAIPEDCHLCTEISKRRTIMQATVVSYHLFVFLNNANTVSAEMWVLGFGNHKWYKSLKSRVKFSWFSVVVWHFQFQYDV
jgi:hypothetical protein